MENILKLMQEQGDQFGNTSLEDLKNQMKLYGLWNAKLYNISHDAMTHNNIITRTNKFYRTCFISGLEATINKSITRISAKLVFLLNLFDFKIYKFLWRDYNL